MEQQRWWVTRGSHDESSTGGRRGSRACNSERWLRIYQQRRVAASDRALSHRGAGERRTDGVAFYPSGAWIQLSPTVVVVRNRMKGEFPETLIPSIRSSHSIFFYPD
jgi:hypothetical protein